MEIVSKKIIILDTLYLLFVNKYPKLFDETVEIELDSLLDYVSWFSKKHNSPHYRDPSRVMQHHLSVD